MLAWRDCLNRTMFDSLASLSHLFVCGVFRVQAEVRNIDVFTTMSTEQLPSLSWSEIHICRNRFKRIGV